MTATLPPPPPSPAAPPPVPAEPALDANFGTPGAMAALVVAAVAVDLAINTALAGWAVLGAVLATVVGLAATNRVPSRPALAIAAAALLPALFLGVRANPWLLVLDILAVLGLLALGGARAQGGDLFDTRFTTLARQAGTLVVSLVIAPGALVHSATRMRSDRPARTGRGYGAIIRGLALTVPIVLVLGAALASGDAVFASMVSVDLVVPDNSGAHVLATLAGLWLAAAVLTQATLSRSETRPERRPLLGPLEGSMVLAGLIAVYALFAVARLLVALKGDTYVLETTGLTYAEYARSGFFQLLGAAALTAVVLLGLRSAVDLPTAATRRIFAVLAAAAVALTLVMVHSATIRLGLYDAAFGLTRLRLFSTIFAWWVGAVLVLVGLSLCGVGARRSWLPGVVACSALVALLVVNAMDPDRMIMARNVDHFGETGRFDLVHAMELSDDGLQVLIARRGELSDDVRLRLRERLCGPYRAAPSGSSFNLSIRSGADARAELCATG